MTEVIVCSAWTVHLIPTAPVTCRPGVCSKEKAEKGNQELNLDVSSRVQNAQDCWAQREKTEEVSESKLHYRMWNVGW